MKLSTKARYATRALIELTRHYEKGPVRLKDIAEKQGISAKYLEQVLFPLNIQGLVRTRKGSGGGHFLGRDPEEINLAEIINIVEGSLAPVECVDDPKRCTRYETCEARKIWCRLKDVIVQELESINLKELSKI